MGNEIAVDRVIEVVAAYFRISAAKLRSKSISQSLTKVRQLAMYLSRKHTGCSFPEISKRFSERSHQAVIYAIERIESGEVYSTDVVADVERRLSLVCTEPSPNWTSGEIKLFVANFFSLKPRRLVGKEHYQHVAMPRMIAVYLCRFSRGYSYPELGKLFGGKHHTTMMHAHNKIVRMLADLAETEPEREWTPMVRAAVETFLNKKKTPVEPS